ncbi:MAG: hypothetical protein DRJ49_07365 [Thermoprotei archaeon]|nr:MAG: hypothetical protein DRJ49_07365 [Thermoprotei archaeon]
MRISLYTIGDALHVLAIVQLDEEEVESLKNLMDQIEYHELKDLVKSIFKSEVEEIKLSRGVVWYKGLEMPYLHLAFMLEDSSFYHMDLVPTSITVFTNDDIFRAKYLIRKFFIEFFNKVSQSHRLK